jgi:hypothetical protein
MCDLPIGKPEFKSISKFRRQFYYLSTGFRQGCSALKFKSTLHKQADLKFLSEGDKQALGPFMSVFRALNIPPFFII